MPWCRSSGIITSSGTAGAILMAPPATNEATPIRQRPDTIVTDLVLPSETALTDQIRRALPEAEACLFMPTADGHELLVARLSKGLPASVESTRVLVGEGLAGWV